MPSTQPGHWDGNFPSQRPLLSRLPGPSHWPQDRGPKEELPSCAQSPPHPGSSLSLLFLHSLAAGLSSRPRLVPPPSSAGASPQSTLPVTGPPPPLQPLSGDPNFLSPMGLLYKSLWAPHAFSLCSSPPLHCGLPPTGGSPTKLQQKCSSPLPSQTTPELQATPVLIRSSPEESKFQVRAEGSLGGRQG